METSLGVNQAMISLDRTTPLTSIENRTEIVEKEPLSSEDFKPKKGCQSNRLKSGDGRYSVSSSSSLIKNNFYAIHHSFKFNENNDPNHQQEKSAALLLSSSPSSSSITSSPTSATLATMIATSSEAPLALLPSTPQHVATPPATTDITNQIGRKRQTPDPTIDTTTAPEIIGAVSPSPTTTVAIAESNDGNNSKRKKLRQIVKHRKLLDSHSSTNNNTSQQQQEYCLFKSCSSIWPGASHSLGEFSHQNITELSHLLKIRLCQAKFKIMATLDQENDLFDFLNDEYMATPQSKSSSHTIHLPNAHHQSTMSVIGNGKNLFRRYAKKHQNNNGNQKTSTSAGTVSTSSKENNDETTGGGKKQKKDNSQGGKTKRISKRRSVACDIPSVILSDGTRVYVCEPCGKKYKNRNGLTYHLERCKNKVKKEEPSKLNCICSQSSPSNQQQQQQEKTSLIQCEKCRSLLHTECMGLNADAATHHDFICPHCKEDPKQSQYEEINTQKTVSTTVSKPSPLIDDLYIADDEEATATDIQNDDNKGKNTSNNNSSNNNNMNDNGDNNNNNNSHDNEQNSALHVWDDFSFTSALDKVFEPWSMLSEEEPFSSQYDSSDIQAQWNMNNLLNQPPSLLFSDATLSSTLEDDSVMVSSELTPAPISEHSPPTSALMSDAPTIIQNNNNTVNTPAQHSTDGLWFQFANFDDDYQCEQ